MRQTIAALEMVSTRSRIPMRGLCAWRREYRAYRLGIGAPIAPAILAPNDAKCRRTGRVDREIKFGIRPRIAIFIRHYVG